MICNFLVANYTDISKELNHLIFNQLEVVSRCSEKVGEILNYLNQRFEGYPLQRGDRL